jgi:preprotein translocase subunit YajC
MIDVAGAQTAGAAEQAPMLVTFLQFLPLVLVFLIFYFLVIRPQSAKQRAVQKMIENLKKGDRVLTSGGIYGDVVDVKQDSAILKVGDSPKGDGIKMEFTKQSIVGVQSKTES